MSLHAALATYTPHYVRVCAGTNTNIKVDEGGGESAGDDKEWGDGDSEAAAGPSGIADEAAADPSGIADGANAGDEPDEAEEGGGGGREREEAREELADVPGEAPGGADRGEWD